MDAAGVRAQRAWGARQAEGPCVCPWGAPGSSAVEPAWACRPQTWTRYALDTVGGRWFSYLFCELLDVRPGPGPGLGTALRTACSAPGTGLRPAEARGNVKGPESAKGGPGTEPVMPILVGAGGLASGWRPGLRCLPCPAAAPPSPWVPGQPELSLVVGCQERAAASKLQGVERGERGGAASP